MEIAAATKISTLIKANPDAIEAIASINRHFEKLRNPLLRKILASRVTIADAARIGGCDVETFFEKLVPLGFTVKQQGAGVPVKPAPTPAVFHRFLEKLPQNALIQLDVREDIASGNDPFLEIMKGVDQINGQNALVIINTFEPTPLIQILKKRGYVSFTQEKAEDLVYCYFWKEGNPTAPAETIPATAPNSAEYEQLLQKYQDHLTHLDVRHLEMPQPMVSILDALERLAPEEALHVTHQRVPRFLLPKLQERHFEIVIKEVNPSEVHLLIYKET
ncbi:hypothetical protein TH63_11700 [Rufibacter radiotolerans]|uniref:DUF2249 domain-containing protein n=1 Tax=Rufibacter radiotolerans TaxID=1379910 RepID=A0A0H4VQY9_9BACT|nr:DUF2249 domain-containing protein [Rufibacter radiotolerans]AKQ46144.1 hypothetical protein TH63_11700 [Rufibacter radiotolerans]